MQLTKHSDICQRHGYSDDEVLTISRFRPFSIRGQFLMADRPGRFCEDDPSMSERITKPQSAITPTSYAELRQFAAAFGAGKLNLLILVGRAGIAKSQTLQQVVGERALWIEGNATAFGIYQAIYEHRDKPIVIAGHRSGPTLSSVASLSRRSGGGF